MSQKDSETFKEYAQRWREMAAQVDPSLSDKKMIALFIDTLREPFYDKMIGSTSSNFSDIVIIGERVESGMKSERITCLSSRAATVKKPSNMLGKKRRRS